MVPLRYSFPPMPSASGGQNLLSTYKTQLIALGAVISFVVLVCIGLAACKFAKNAKARIVGKLRPTPRAPHVASAALWEADGTTMENLFQEITKEKPVKFSAQQLHTFTTNFSTQPKCGGFGEVYKGEFPNGVKIAIKLLNNLSLLEKKVEEQFMAEICSISRIHHVNVAKLYGYCYEDSMTAIVLEYMENGSLDEYFFSRTRVIEWGSLHDIAIGTARGLAHLHEECQQRIIHYDIKPANIFLDSNFVGKVGNFGLVKPSIKDTPGYSAPEFKLSNYRLTNKCDVYSFGMVLFEIIGRKSNVEMAASGRSHWFPQQVWDAYEKGKLKELVVGCGIGEDDAEKACRACEVALWCVQDCSDERPPMSVVVKMLEGGVEIMPPPKPFQYSNMIQTSLQRTQNNSQWYREALIQP